MSPPMKKLNIAASTQRVDVDNRMSLRFYFRIADNMLKQANIYREENNLIDLYIILLRFSSLVSETIPKHQDYKSATVKEKNECKKKLLAALQELEAIKPEVLRRVDEINKAHEASISQVDYGDSLEWPPRRAESISFNNGQSQGYVSSGTNGGLPNTWKTKEQVKDQRISSSQIDWQMNRLALNIPLPKEETLSRHSLLGPNGLRGQWQSSRPSSRVQVQYPSHGDLSPIEIPSFDQGIQNSVSTSEVSSTSTSTSVGDELLQLIDSNSVASTAVALAELSVPSIVRQPSPPPVLAPVKNMPISLENSQVSHMNVADPRPGPAKTIQDVLANSQGPRSIQISTKMMDEFMRMSKSNTQKNLETCAVLTAKLKKNTFYVTTLIVPKQESTSDTCQTTNEEEIYEVQDKRSLFTVGWIHTHPSQSCFMSSVDLHTHYSYQIMLSEAIAIVMSPTDPERKYGIFHLSDPGGVTVIKKCDRRGFHPHEDTPDGSPIYEHCAHVLMSPSLKFDVVDLR